jgi:poly(hydroxyalkanoate) granule-associated protein
MFPKNPFDPNAMTDNMKEQAQQIWLAGLGAFAKAQQDGTRAFEKLVSDGIGMQRQAHQAAHEKISEASERVSEAARTMNERATGQWGKLENIFEDRVARALQSMGVPSAQELHELQARVVALEERLAQYEGHSPSTSAASSKASAPASAKKTTSTTRRTSAK